MFPPSSCNYSAPSSSSALLRHPLASPTSRPPENDITNSWILEFVLRQPIPNCLAHQIFLSLPFSSSFHPHLRKTLLLERIASEIRSCSVSERTLHSLELIEEHDRIHGAAPSNSLKAAYCAVAVECTAAARRSGAEDFADAVKRIWKARIADLERSEAAAGLVSGKLVEWAKRMERCDFGGEDGKGLFDWDIEDGMNLVGDYLKEVTEEMGPSFLQIAGAVVEDGRMDLSGFTCRVGQVNGDDQCAGKLEGKCTNLEDNGMGEKCEGLGGVSVRGWEDDGVLVRSGVLEDACRKDLEDDGIREESGDLGDASTKEADGCYGAEAFQLDPAVEVEDKERCFDHGGHDMSDPGGGLMHKLDPTEDNKVKKALKRSRLDLEMMVEASLSEVEIAAAAVLTSMSNGDVYFNEPTKNSSKGAVLPDSANELVAEVPAGLDTTTGALVTQISHNLVPLPDVVNRDPSDSRHLEKNAIVEECHKDAEPRKPKDNLVHHTHFDKNLKGYTSELSDDSVQSKFVKSSGLSSSPKARRISPPRLDERKLLKRRAVKRWTLLEENTLREAVAKHGIGNWKLILSFNAEIFDGRTEVDLKDKWRNMSRYLLKL